MYKVYYGNRNLVNTESEFILLRVLDRLTEQKNEQEVMVIEYVKEFDTDSIFMRYTGTFESKYKYTHRIRPELIKRMVEKQDEEDKMRR